MAWANELLFSFLPQTTGCDRRAAFDPKWVVFVASKAVAGTSFINLACRFIVRFREPFESMAPYQIIE